MKTIKLFLAVIVMAVISSASYARMPLAKFQNRDH